MILLFEFPLPENLGNNRMHWRTKNAKKKEYYAMLDGLVSLRHTPLPPKKPWHKAEAEIQMRTLRRMDQDNAHSRLKWIRDWIETRGYVVNDRDLAYVLDARVAERKHLGVTVVLREVA